ncbi:hypothetical protein LINPERPRIM_LOCUS1574 [Linum perenne]
MITTTRMMFHSTRWTFGSNFITSQRDTKRWRTSRRWPIATLCSKMLTRLGYSQELGIGLSGCWSKSIYVSLSRITSLSQLEMLERRSILSMKRLWRSATAALELVILRLTARKIREAPW